MSPVDEPFSDTTCYFLLSKSKKIVDEEKNRRKIFEEEINEKNKRERQTY